jgi:hypothetical protein
MHQVLSNIIFYYIHEKLRFPDSIASPVQYFLNYRTVGNAVMVELNSLFIMSEWLQRKYDLIRFKKLLLEKYSFIH